MLPLHMMELLAETPAQCSDFAGTLVVPWAGRGDQDVLGEELEHVGVRRGWIRWQLQMPGPITVIPPGTSPGSDSTPASQVVSIQGEPHA